MSRAIIKKKEILEQRIFKDKLILSCFITFILLVSISLGKYISFVNNTYIISKIGIDALFITLVFACSFLFIFSHRRCKDIEYICNDLRSVEIMKEEFISNMRHELKTPLNPIMGYSEILYNDGMGPINEKQRELLKRIIENSQKLDKRVDLLVFLSIASSGSIKYSFDFLRIEDVLNHITREANPHIVEKEMILNIDYTKDIPLIYGDRTYLIEVFEQLIDNAIKFTGIGGKIRVSAYEGYKSIHIKIIDNGIGIHENKIDNIFERFYQIDGSKSRRYNGNGIGLYISKTIIEAHNGDIWIESEEGVGSIVHVKLPTPTTTET